MLLESLSCGNCGAPLQVPNNASYVTCLYCRSSLAVKRAGGAAYTEVLDRIDERTERMSEDLTAILLHNELERMDREWALTEERLEEEAVALSRSLNRARREKPGFALPVLGLLVGISLYFALQPYGMRVGSPLIETIIIGWSAIALATAIGKARRLDRLEQAYSTLREAHLTAAQEYNDKRREVVLRLDGRNSR